MDQQRRYPLKKNPVLLVDVDVEHKLQYFDSSVATFLGENDDVDYNHLPDIMHCGQDDGIGRRLVGQYIVWVLPCI